MTVQGLLQPCEGACLRCSPPFPLARSSRSRPGASWLKSVRSCRRLPRWTGRYQACEERTRADDDVIRPRQRLECGDKGLGMRGQYFDGVDCLALEGDLVFAVDRRTIGEVCPQ